MAIRFHFFFFLLDDDTQSRASSSKGYEEIMKPFTVKKAAFFSGKKKKSLWSELFSPALNWWLVGGVPCVCVVCVLENKFISMNVWQLPRSSRIRTLMEKKAFRHGFGLEFTTYNAANWRSWLNFCHSAFVSSSNASHCIIALNGRQWLMYVSQKGR